VFYLNQLHITINSPKNTDFEIAIFNIEGKNVDTVVTQKNFLGESRLSKNIAHLPAGVYTIRATGRVQQENVEYIQTIKFIKID